MKFTSLANSLSIQFLLLQNRAGKIILIAGGASEGIGYNALYRHKPPVFRRFQLAWKGGKFDEHVYLC